MNRYNKGARLERDVMKIFWSWGWVAYRSAGSHGCADVMALKAGHEALLIQCKTDGKISPADRDGLLIECGQAAADAILADRPKRGVIRLRRVLTEGFDDWP